jgi:hypothetical protein
MIKTNPADEYHLKQIESINASTSGNNIYSFETLFDSTTTQGSLKGKPVGVEYLGADYKTVTLSFPLYYMNQMLAEDLISYIMVNKFNEIVSVKEEVSYISDRYSLLQNYPNPFNPSTKISWQSPVGSWQTLKVYDILGNEVATLVNEYRNAGNYEIDFQSTNSGHQLANGVYFYQLRTGDFVETKKMILLK